MENYIDFLGKDLDDCIGQAMNYYGCDRDNLEIDIIQEAKSGIFGIVGARKAKIRARRAHVREKVANMLNSGDSLDMEDKAGKKVANGAGEKCERCGKPASAGHRHRHDQGERREREEKTEKQASPSVRDKIREVESRPSQKPAPSAKPEGTAVSGAEPHVKTDTPVPHVRGPRIESRAEEIAAPMEVVDENGDDLENTSWPARPLSELDGELLRARTVEILRHIMEPIAGRPLDMSVELAQRSIRVHVDWEGDAGLLIGRDGQTMIAAQYLASRIVSRLMKSVVHVQLDISNYRARQDDKLREMARALAEKVEHTGKPMSTSSLSAYHRRLVHLCLQANEGVQTRSVGEGPMKRVLISPKRPCQP